MLINSEINVTSRTNIRRAIIIFLTLFSIVTSFIWTSKFRFGVFAQDDPWFFDVYRNSAKESIGVVIGNRWRPFADILYYGFIRITGDSYFKWWIVATLILWLQIFVVSLIVYRATRKIMWSSAFFLIAFTSRFFYGQIANLAFLGEAAANTLLVIVLYLLLKFRKSRKAIYIYASATFYSLLILTHERYIVLPVFIILFIFLTSKLTTEQRLLFSAISTIPVLTLVFVKIYVLEIPIVVGTGSATESGFSISTSIKHLSELIFGLFGANVGASYLNGLTINMQSNFLIICSLILTASTLYYIKGCLTIRYRVLDRTGITLKEFAILLVTLVVPVISTIRIEQRWYIMPFIACLFVTIVLIPDYIEKNGVNKFRVIAFLILSTQLVLNVNYRDRVELLYFSTTQTIVKAQVKLIESVKKSYGNISGKTLLIFDSSNTLSEAQIYLDLKANGFSNPPKIFVRNGVVDEDLEPDLIADYDPSAITFHNLRARDGDISE